MLRINIGFIVCSLAYPIIILLSGADGAFAGAAIVGTFTIGASVIFGLPLFMWFVRRGWTSIWHALLAGGGAGLLSSLPFAFAGTAAHALVFASMFIAIGVVHSIAFWLIAMWRNHELGALALAPSENSATIAHPSQVRQ